MRTLLRAKPIRMALPAGTVCLCFLAACANPDDGSEGNPGKRSEKVLDGVARDPAIAAMVPSEVAERGSLTAAVNPSSPPIKFIGANGQITGFTPQLVAAAGKIMGVKVGMQQTSFDALIPGLESRRFDVILSINDLAERREKTDFIDYLKTGTAILAKTSLSRDKVTPKSLCGLSVGYVRGNVQQKLVGKADKECRAAGRPEVSGSAFQDINAAILAVQSGQVDTAWGDAPSISYNAQKNPEAYKEVYKDISGPYGVGVNKSRPELRKALHAALRKCVEDGVYRKLLADYGLSEYALPDMPINAGPADDGE